MIPAMSSITLLFIKEDKNNTKANTATAPKNAPNMTEKNPESVNTPVAMVPPPASITSATPKLAPELIPKMEESANGLLNTVCNISPEADKAAPQSKAVMH